LKLCKINRNSNYEYEYNKFLNNEQNAMMNVNVVWSQKYATFRTLTKKEKNKYNSLSIKAQII